MRWILPVVFVCAVCSVGPAQSVPTKKQAAGLVQKAVESSTIGAGWPAFHLIAKIHYEAYGKSWDGVYELLWASPDRTHEEFLLGTLGETDVVVGGKRYVLRNTPGMQLGLDRVRASIPAPLLFLKSPEFEVSKVYLVQTEGSTEICVSANDLSDKRGACFDAKSSNIVSAKFALDQKNPALETVVDDFVPLGSKWYPRHDFSHRSEEKLELNVQKLELVTKFDESVFVPPAGATAFEWCAEPRRQGKLTPTRLQDNQTNIFAETLRGRIPISLEHLAYYVLVSPEGRVVKSVPLVVLSKKTQTQTEHWLQIVKFPIEACNGKPVEYERIYEESAPISLNPR